MSTILFDRPYGWHSILLGRKSSTEALDRLKAHQPSPCFLLFLLPQEKKTHRKKYNPHLGIKTSIQLDIKIRQIKHRESAVLVTWVPISQHSFPTGRNLEDHALLLRANLWVPGQCLLLQPARQLLQGPGHGQKVVSFLRNGKYKFF